MRVHVHDFSGHPFQVQLSRELARRGHEVLHSYSSQYVSGHGRLRVTADDPATLRIESVTADRPIVKYGPLGRARFEMAYARAWQRRLRDETFDVVLVCNVPLFALTRMARYFARRRQPWVFWHQDLYSMGVNAEIARRLPAPLATPLCRGIDILERLQVRAADRVVAIGDSFLARYEQWGLSTDHVSVQPNWAPLDELRPGTRDNPWSRRHDLGPDRLRLLYSGTLGRKHNPLLLVELLDATQARGVAAELIVCSEGDGADQLRAVAGRRDDVTLLGYQPAEQFADVLASADVMVALLEPDAAVFSVPSKVLSYLSAGRPTIALMPDDNDAARDVRSVGGFVGTPDASGAKAAATWLAEAVTDPQALAGIGREARATAERRFDITKIGARFEDILHAAADGGTDGHGDRVDSERLAS